MQCDSHCSEYKACVPSCAVETCDNMLTQAKDQQLCKSDTCVEGCLIKPCPVGDIYRNDSYTECVPKAVCRPICLQQNGVDYYEGDVIRSDKCHTCHCSKGKEICSGTPCAPEVISVPPIISQDESQSCRSGWSEWINQEMANYQDKTKKTLKLDDREPLPTAFMLKNYKGSAFCDAEHMEQIECRTVNEHLHPKETGEDVECSLEKGLICVGECHDYETRVLCNCNDDVEVFPVPIVDHHKPTKRPREYYTEMTTQPTTLVGSICNPAIPHVEKVGSCHDFYHCTMNISGVWTFADKTCGMDMMFNPQAMVCDHIDNVKRIKPECGALPIVPIITPPIQIVTQPPPKITPPPVVRPIPPTERPYAQVIEVTPQPITLVGSICNPAIPHVEKPGNCHQFYHCTMNVSGVWTFVEKTCGDTMMFNPPAMVCDFIDSVKRIKPECGQLPVTNEVVVEKVISKCPDGKVWHECAVPCGRACHYYKKLLVENGLCTISSDACIPGCLPVNAVIQCASNQFWRDPRACVSHADCTCRSDDGTIVKVNLIIFKNCFWVYESRLI